MKQFLVAALFGSAGFVDAFAGTITGSVRGEPPAAPPEAAGSGAYESRRYKYVEKIDYDRLRDFVVYIDQPGGGFGAGGVGTETVKTTPAKTTQKDANFDPH